MFLHLHGEVCDLVAEIRAAQRLTPVLWWHDLVFRASAMLTPCEVLAQMCEECDVEMFMVLPRHSIHRVSPAAHDAKTHRRDRKVGMA